MSKIIRKLAVLRDEDDGCPYGLDIPFACKCVGATVNKMAPLSLFDGGSEDEMVSLIRANKDLLIIEGDGGNCPYADKILENSVNCVWSEGEASSTDQLASAPFYSKVYDNSSYDGLLSYPLGYYGDNNISRNSYYGAFSLQGSSEVKKKASMEFDIKNAVEHIFGSEFYTGKVCIKFAYEGDLSLSELEGWKTIPFGEDDGPIVLLSTDFGDYIIGGFNLINVEIDIDSDFVPVIILNQDPNGHICFEFDNGKLK